MSIFGDEGPVVFQEILENEDYEKDYGKVI